MPRNVYWELFYHLIWRTRDSASMLDARVEPFVHKYLIHRALQTSGVIVHAVGGIEDHVHMAVSLPPTIEIAKWVGDIKGASAHAVNHALPRIGMLAWQTGYGVVPFGKRDLPWVVAYIRSQRAHHDAGRVEDRLERIVRVDEAGPEDDVAEAR